MRNRLLFFLLVALLCCFSPIEAQNDVIDIRRLMSADEFQRAGLQKLNEQEVAVLNGWLRKFLFAAATAKGSGDQSFAELEGAFIVADDGQFLGKITTNSLDSKSIINSIGSYGSDLSATSIFNTVGKYGSDVSRLSPFNDVTSTPPKVFKGERFMGYLTTNMIKTPRIDPHALVGWLKSQE